MSEFAAACNQPNHLLSGTAYLAQGEFLVHTEELAGHPKASYHLWLGFAVLLY